MNFEVNSIMELEKLSKKWLKLNPDPVICFLNGDMGAGKTTFIKSICQELGVKELISSPTFSLVNEYETEKGSSVFHFDLYRVNDSEELYDLGFEEYLDKNCYVFIEWPAIAIPFFNVDERNILITISNEYRVFKFF